VNRRSFFALSATGLAAVALPRPSGGTGRSRLDRIGVQLYSVRDALQRDFEGTLARASSIGYEEV
jgi:hypothetical protein